ncbi:MAG: rRNA pseudouridine synthase [Nitrospinae bacterium]|nr:rRNA pseudouridine synthase [Nitrospinota bacterium]
MKKDEAQEDDGVRINKYLSSLGIAARRKIDEMILEGRVLVNGKLLKKPGIKIDIKKDSIKIDNKIVTPKETNLIYILLNKPKGTITSTSDDKKRPTIFSCLPEFHERIYPVGRLDFASEGALLLTNDGELAYKLTHPKFLVTKIYTVKVSGIPDQGDLKLIRKKLLESTQKHKVDPKFQQNCKIVEKSGNNAWMEFNIYEGKNREIRNLCEMVYHPVLKLKRTKFAFLTLKDLPIGEFRFLKDKEIKMLRNITK